MKRQILNVRTQKLLRPSFKRRGMAQLEKGTIIYVIPFSNGKYFTYGYTNKETAIKVAARLENADLNFNSTSEVRAISDLKPEEL